MRVLVADASTRRLLVGLVEDGRVVAARGLEGRSRASALVVEIDAALAAAGCDLGSVDLIGVGRGPGSFTGVRVVLATATGLALGAGLPVIGVETLSAWAAAAGEASAAAPELLVALDGGHGEAFVQRFERRTIGADGHREVAAGPWRALGEPTSMVPEALAAAVRALPPAAVVVGGGAERRRELLAPALAAARAALVEPPAPARLVAALAALTEAAAIGAGDRLPPRPLYVRGPDARRFASPG